MMGRMRANRAYHLITSRVGPTFLADEHRLDRVEVVSIDDGEVVLFWDLPVKLAAKLLRELRADLAGMDAVRFTEKWADADAAPDA
jgi:hypothetical protein